jgi:hypothetical protein
MGRTSVAPRAVVAILVLLFAGGCFKDPASGTLTVSEPLPVKSSSGLLQLEPGQYPVRVFVDDGRHLKLKIDRRPGEVVTARVKAERQPDERGAARIPSGVSGQPFDLAYTLTSTTNEIALPSSDASCRYETMEVRCRTVYSRSTGDVEPREECGTERVERIGTRRTSTVRATQITTLSGQMLDPASGRGLARLSAFAQRNRTYTQDTPCGGDRLIR